MIGLDDPLWSAMADFHSEAAVIPVLLKGLEVSYRLRPAEDGDEETDDRSELWEFLCNALCDQGDVYPASYAAVPHIVRIGLTAPDLTPTWDDVGHFFALPASIEIERRTHGPEMPAALSEPYFTALRQLHDLAYRLRHLDWDQSVTQAILGALAVAKGDLGLGNTILMLSSSERQEQEEELFPYQFADS